MGDTPIISLWRFEFTKVWSLPLHRTVAVFVMEELHVQGMIVGWTSKVIHVCRPKLARIHQQQRQQRQGADWDEARNPIGSCAPARASWHVSFRLGRRYHGLIGTLFFAYTWFWGSTLNIDFFSVDTFLFLGSEALSYLIPLHATVFNRFFQLVTCQHWPASFS